MRIVNWNICHGGRNADDIVQLLIEKDADLIVLTEFKCNHIGDKITNGLKAEGYFNRLVSSTNPAKNGVGVFVKLPVELKSDPINNTETIIVFEFQRYDIIATFCADDSLTKEFFAKMHKVDVRRDTIIIGDLNTGPRGSVPNRYKDIDKLRQKGFCDIWRLKHAEPCWSFQSPTGKSQPDHVLCKFGKNIEQSPDLFDVYFDLSPIHNKISDHGIMVFGFEHEKFWM